MNALVKEFLHLHPVIPLLKPKATPLDFGKVLSIHNNDFHPTLNIQGVTAFMEAAHLIEHNVKQLLPLADLLKEYPIRLNEFLLGLNYLNSYIYILHSTCEIEKNARLLKYAQSKAGA